MSEAAATLPESPSALGRTLLGLYLMGVVVVSTWILTSIFPATVTVTAKTAVHEVEGRAVPDASGPLGRQLAFRPWSVGNRILLPALEPDQGLIVLALLAGSLGAFMHAAQSFAAFVGNRELKSSWAWWYLLRPPNRFRARARAVFRRAGRPPRRRE